MVPDIGRSSDDPERWQLTNLKQRIVFMTILSVTHIMAVVIGLVVGALLGP